MNEVQRQAYLEAMGIDSWFPRYVLPGAAPSRPCAWPEDYLPVRASPRPTDAVPEPGPSRPAAEAGPVRSRPAPPRSAREALRDSPPAPGPRPQSPPAVMPTDGKGASVRFHLAFMRCGALAVLNQLPDLGRERLGAGQRQLFLNLVKALGLPPEAVRIQEESFRWPFAEALMGTGADAARLALRAYVDHQAGDGPFRVLLVLGEQLAPFVLPPAQAEGAQTGRLFRPAETPWPVLLSRSLDEMLRLPALKREVWRDLAALPALGADA